MKVKKEKIVTSTEHIPAKPPNVLLMDYCAFCIMKRALSKRKPTATDRLKKVAEEE